MLLGNGLIISENFGKKGCRGMGSGAIMVVKFRLPVCEGEYTVLDLSGSPLVLD